VDSLATLALPPRIRAAKEIFPKSARAICKGVRKYCHQPEFRGVSPIIDGHAAAGARSAARAVLRAPGGPLRPPAGRFLDFVPAS
jgi:hypothetical protein